MRVYHCRFHQLAVGARTSLLRHLGCTTRVASLSQLVLASAPAGLQQDPPDGVNASPQMDNIMQWNAIIFGPEGTIWDGGERWRGRLLYRLERVRREAHTQPAGPTCPAGVFKLSLEFSEDYPNKAPVVKFRTRMYHPNSACSPVLPLRRGAPQLRSGAAGRAQVVMPPRRCSAVRTASL